MTINPFISGRPLRVLFFGMRGELSLAPLRSLLAAPAAQVEVCGVVVPADDGAAADLTRLRPVPAPSDLPMVNRFVARTIVQLGWEQGLPVFEMGRPGARSVLEGVAALRPDVGVVSCFSKKLPRSLLNLPPAGFLNLHPSLLPAYRGPQPLFWMARAGEEQGGVTVHVMDEGLDTGDIVLQRPVVLEDGLSGGDIAWRHGAAGGSLLVEALALLAAGRLPRRPQPEEGGSYFSTPEAADFRLDPAWPARRAFNFMRATAHWGRPYPLTVEGRTLHLKTAVSCDPDERLETVYVEQGGVAAVPFTPGVLRAQLT